VHRDHALLRGAFAQVVLGVSALHRAGKLHRDLKPSNVLVTATGRVVVLDFGVVASLGREGIETLERSVVGTPRYMSPEQAIAEQLTTASDWYSVGVMLYEALSGEAPFHGGLLEMAIARLTAGPPPLPDFVPPDLAALCLDLLQPKPEKRPHPNEILARLGATSAVLVRSTVLPLSSASARVPTAFVGRERHMAALTEGFEAAASGRPALVYVHGGSGMGKSLLVRRFLEGVEAAGGGAAVEGEAVVLAGRCYERDSVPYKALDSVVDALSRHLRLLSQDQLEAILPADVRALSRLFPVLGRVEAIHMSPRGRRLAADPQEERRRAATAFRGLLGSLAIRRPLVVWMDDLQWADVDSAALVSELVRGPAAPPVLWIASYRSDHPVTALVSSLREAHTTMASADLFVRDVEVSVLERDHACSLATALLGEHPEARSLAPIIANESRGSPFFVEELVHDARAGRRQSASLRREPPKLEEVILARVASLPREARSLLEIVAIAGTPIAASAAVEAAEIEAEHDISTLAMLRNGRFVRVVRIGQREEIDTYHDSIREAVVSALGASVRARMHRRVAFSLVAHGDPEALVFHFREAGEHAMAAEHAANAAERAAKAFAFDRAAMLWRMALDMSELAPAARSALQSKLGDALACAGRGDQAAAAYRAACEDASEPHRLELRRRAAEQLLRCGRIREGVAAIDEVMRSVRMGIPTHPLLVVAALVLYDLLLRVRGLRHRLRDAAQLPSTELTRIDICWSVGATLAIVKPIYAKIYQKRHLLLSLAAGEPTRVARGIVLEATSCSTGGSRSRQRTSHLLATARALTDRLSDPYVSALALGGEGISAYFEGRWRAALERCEEGAERMTDLADGRNWETATAIMVSLWSLFQLGDMQRLSARVAALAQEARRRGDQYLATNIRIGVANAGWLAADDPARAEAELDDAMACWGSSEQQVQRYHEVVARVHIALYRGQGGAADVMVAERWSELESANLLRVQTVRVGLHHLRARALLGAMVDRGLSGDELARAARETRASVLAMRRERIRWASGLAGLTEAALCVRLGRQTRAIPVLRRAIDVLEASDMRLWAACGRRRLGELTAGPAGLRLVAEADGQARSLGVCVPERLVRVLAPGFDTPIAWR